MPNNTLILPIAGRAERILSLPKFLLPISDSETLLASHVNSALAAGFKDVLVIARKEHSLLVKDQLMKLDKRVQVTYTHRETKTMCETLLDGISSRTFSGQVSIALADSNVLGGSLINVYGEIIKQGGNSLSLFRPRIDQLGKLGQVDLDVSGKVIKMVDKDNSIQLPWIWGIASFDSTFLESIDPGNAHIGISVEKWISQGKTFLGIQSQGSYYDCGTFAEYKSFLLANPQPQVRS